MGRVKRYHQTSKLLMKWFRSHYDLDQTNFKELRSATHDIFKTVREQLAGTNEANKEKMEKKLTEQIKLNDKKSMKNDGTNRIYKIFVFSLLASKR